MSIDVGWMLTAAALFVALLAFSGCSATGEMPVCQSGCTMQKSWGL